MLSASDLLAAADQPEPERPSLLTGFRDLDGLTGGIRSISRIGQFESDERTGEYDANLG